MKQFLTLLKRDLIDNKGALIITPLVIAGVILAIVLGTIAVGKYDFEANNGFRFNQSHKIHGKGEITVDGEEFKVYKDKTGTLVMQSHDGQIKPVAGNLAKVDKAEATQAFVAANGVGALLPVMVSLISVLFVLSSGLFEERKDRSIMFWKSLPISDFKTVGAKFTSVVVGGIGFATLVSIALHFLLMVISYLVVATSGINLFDIGEIARSSVNIWLMFLVLITGYVIWALPVYAWFLTAGAYVPKAPFLAAILPIALVPILGRIFAQSIVDYLVIPLQHITAEPMLKSIQNSVGSGNDFENISQMVTPFINGVTSSLAQPQVWIGVLVAGALLYGASEIRRRHAI